MVEEWRLVNLGAQDGYTIQSVYEAVAASVGRGVVPNTIILCYPSHPYVCIGVHQALELEVDLDYCRGRGIPVVRRQVGGGTVYLDSGQQFYHVIVRRDHPLALKPVPEFFKEVLKAVVDFYRSYGLNASYKPVNDVVIDGRKASGNGAASLHGSMVLIGNVILDVDPRLMARVLRVPSEKFRDKIARSISEWVTCLRRELGYVPLREEVVERLKECFEKALGVRLVEGGLTEEELLELERVRARLMSDEWLYMRSLPRPELLTSRKVKVREGHYVVQVDHKATKMVRVVAEVVDGRLADVMITGDFFVQPYTALNAMEKAVKGLPLERDALREALEGAVRESGASLAGISVDDVVEALMKIPGLLETL